MRFPSARFFAISESLSGDGRTIAIAGHDPDHPELKLVPLEGSTEARSLPVKLPEPGVLSSAARAANDAGFFAQVQTSTGYELVFTDRGGNGIVLRKTYVPAWGLPSPDGKRLAFVDQTSNTKVWIGKLVPSESAVDLNEPVH